MALEIWKTEDEENRKMKKNEDEENRKMKNACCGHFLCHIKRYLLGYIVEKMAKTKE